LNRALNINNIFYIAMAKEYSTLEELYEDACSSDFIVGSKKKSKTNKWFIFSLDTINFYHSLTFTKI